MWRVVFSFENIFKNQKVAPKFLSIFCSEFQMKDKKAKIDEFNWKLCEVVPRYSCTIVISLFLSLFLSIFAYVHDRERVLFPPVLGPLFGAQESAEKNYWQLEWQQLSIGTIAVIVVVNENVFLQKEVFKRGRTRSNVKFFKRWKPQNSNDGSKNNNDCEAKGNASFNVQVWHVKFVEIFFSPQRLQIGTLEGGAPTLFGNFAPREQGRTAPAIGGKRRNLLSGKQLLHFCLLLVVLHSSNQVSRGLSTLPGTTNTTAAQQLFCCNQCDQIGRFLKVSMKNYLQKVAKLYSYVLGLSEKHHF